MVSQCEVRRLGDLPFDLKFGTCSTFMINNLPTVLLCFEAEAGGKRCRSLTRKKNGTLADIEDFVFENEFQVDTTVIPDSKYDHYVARLANYQGFPLALGGWASGGNNNLEMLNTMINPPEWVEYEGSQYPYSDK